VEAGAADQSFGGVEVHIARLIGEASSCNRIGIGGPSIVLSSPWRRSISSRASSPRGHESAGWVGRRVRVGFESGRHARSSRSVVLGACVPARVLRVLARESVGLARLPDGPTDSVASPCVSLMSRLGTVTLPVDFHSFRRAFKTALAGAGVNVQQAMQLAGHSDAKTHMRYVMHLVAMRPIPPPRPSPVCRLWLLQSSQLVTIREGPDHKLY
jgi:hypothetical protein